MLTLGERAGTLTPMRLTATLQPHQILGGKNKWVAIAVAFIVGVLVGLAVPRAKTGSEQSPRKVLKELPKDAVFAVSEFWIPTGNGARSFGWGGLLTGKEYIRAQTVDNDYVVDPTVRLKSLEPPPSAKDSAVLRAHIR